MNLSNLDSLAYFWPEMVLVVAIVAIFLADLFVRDKEVLGNVALLGAALSAALAARAFSWDQGWLFNQMVVLDPFAVFFKLLFSLTAFLVVWMSMDSREVNNSQNQGEYYAILLSAVLGMYFMASAANLLMYPSPGAPMDMRITSITVQSATVARVVWSEVRGGYAPLAPNSTVTLPSGMMDPGSSVIMTDTTYHYTPPLNILFAAPLDLHHTAFRRSRMVDPIPRVP